MKIGIIKGKTNDFVAEQFKKAAKSHGAECVFINPQGTMTVLSRYHNKHKILANGLLLEKNQIDLCIPRITNIKEYKHILYQLTDVHGIFCPVNSAGLEIATDKMRTLQRLAMAKIPVPKTILINSLKEILPALEAIGFPCILKSVNGSKGVGVCKVDTFESAQSTIQALLKYTSPLLVEEFISAAGKDIRAIVVGDRVVASMERSAPEGEFRANLSQGGKGKAITLSSELEELCIKAARALPLQIAGVDIIMNKSREPFVIELNGNPGFGIQKITGKDIANEIVSYSIKQYELTRNRLSDTYSSDLFKDEYLRRTFERVKGNKIAFDDRDGIRREIIINSPIDFSHVITSSFKLNIK